MRYQGARRYNLVAFGSEEVEKRLTDFIAAWVVA